MVIRTVAIILAHFRARMIDRRRPFIQSLYIPIVDRTGKFWIITCLKCTFELLLLLSVYNTLHPQSCGVFLNNVLSIFICVDIFERIGLALRAHFGVLASYDSRAQRLAQVFIALLGGKGPRSAKRHALLLH